MFRIRDRKSVSGVLRTQPMVEIAAADAALPLPDVNWSERWSTFPKGYATIFEQLYNFEVREDDVFVVTFMKCGTTWMQETAWLLMNQLNYERAKMEFLLDRSTHLDQSGLNYKFGAKLPNSIEMCDRQESPRLIKCHMPINLLPKQVWQKKTKIIYVARNVKDVVVSAFHFLKDMRRYTGNMDEFVQDFINNGINYAPYLATLVEFWRLREEPNICFVTYEEMKTDLASVIKKLCTFLQRPQLTVPEMAQIVEHLSFDKIRENKSVNLTDAFNAVLAKNTNESFQFIRRGIVGSYKDELTVEHQKILSDWSSAYLAKYGIKEEDIFGNI